MAAIDKVTIRSSSDQPAKRSLVSCQWSSVEWHICVLVATGTSSTRDVDGGGRQQENSSTYTTVGHNIAGRGWHETNDACNSGEGERDGATRVEVNILYW